MKKIKAANKISPKNKQTRSRSTYKARKPYRKPQLDALGDLRSLTLGGSPGAGDSGSSGTRKWPGMP
jgi:hypothetical protein